MQSIRRPLGWLFVVLGVLLVLDGLLAVLWQEPISALYGSRQQKKLTAELQHDFGRFVPTETELKALAGLRSQRQRYTLLAELLRKRSSPGTALGRISIARIKSNFVFVEGTKPNDLRKGPGHYKATALPGERGTVAIAGHRTTYLAPFRNLDKLKHGDRIVLSLPYGRFIYAVEKTKIVDPSQLTVIAKAPFDRLVLTACHPLYSAKKRIVVFARLLGSVPSGVARANERLDKGFN